MTSNERQIAEAIKQLRAHLNESQQEFSNRLGVTLSTVARYESAKPPKGPILVRIAEIAHTAGREDLRTIIQGAEEAQRTSRVSPIAGAIRQLRSALTCTQQQLAEMAGVAVSTVARAETSTLPDPQVLKKFARVARDHQQFQIALVFDQATIPYFFATREQRERLELKKALLTSIDRLNPSYFKVIQAILSITQPEGNPELEVLAVVDDVPGKSYKEFEQSRVLKSQVLAMLQAADGRLEGLTPREAEEAHILCAAAWLLRNDEAPEELEDFLVDRLQRVLANRESGLTETELEALGSVGARASNPSKILDLARALRETLDSASANAGSPEKLLLSDVIKRARARSLLTPQNFSDLLQVTTDQLEAYESGNAVPDFRTLLLLKSHAIAAMRADRENWPAYTRELAVIRGATLLKFVEAAEELQKD